MDVSAADIVGKRCYQLIHAEDVDAIRQSHVDCEYLRAKVRLAGGKKVQRCSSAFSPPQNMQIFLLSLLLIINTFIILIFLLLLLP